MEFQETLLKGKALINAMILTIQGEFDPNQFDIQGIETAPSDNYKKVGV
jgi:para-aminobenzoate synthetase